MFEFVEFIEHDLSVIAFRLHNGETEFLSSSRLQRIRAILHWNFNSKFFQKSLNQKSKIHNLKGHTQLGLLQLVDLTDLRNDSTPAIVAGDKGRHSQTDTFKHFSILNLFGRICFSRFTYQTIWQFPFSLSLSILQVEFTFFKLF